MKRQLAANTEQAAKLRPACSTIKGNKYMTAVATAIDRSASLHRVRSGIENGVGAGVGLISTSPIYTS